MCSSRSNRRGVVALASLGSRSPAIKYHGCVRITRFKPGIDLGQVEPVIEHAIQDSARAEDLLSRARSEFELLIRRQIEREQIQVKGVVFPADPVVLFFTIANLLPMENLEKQRLLETTDTLERVEELLPVLERNILEAESEDAAETTYYRLAATDLREWITPN